MWAYLHWGFLHQCKTRCKLTCTGAVQLGVCIRAATIVQTSVVQTDCDNCTGTAVNKRTVYGFAVSQRVTNCCQFSQYYYNSQDILLFFLKPQLLESRDYVRISIFLFKESVCSLHGCREKLEDMDLKGVHTRKQIKRTQTSVFLKQTIFWHLAQTPNVESHEIF